MGGGDNRPAVLCAVQHASSSPPQTNIWLAIVEQRLSKLKQTPNQLADNQTCVAKLLSTWANAGSFGNKFTHLVHMAVPVPLLLVRQSLIELSANDILHTWGLGEQSKCTDRQRGGTQAGKVGLGQAGKPWKH